MAMVNEDLSRLMFASSLGPLHVEDVEHTLLTLGANISRNRDALYATIPVPTHWFLRRHPRWSILGTLDPVSGNVVGLDVHYLSGI